MKSTAASFCKEAAVIRAEALTKNYGHVQALKGVDLEVGAEVFWLLGPNGAGKTTFIRIIATLLPPTSGKATVFGHDVVHDRLLIRKMLGYLPQEYGAYPKLTGREYLEYIAYLKGIRQPKEEIEALLSQFGLAQVARRRVTSYSGECFGAWGSPRPSLGTRGSFW